MSNAKDLGIKHKKIIQFYFNTNISPLFILNSCSFMMNVIYIYLFINELCHPTVMFTFSFYTITHINTLAFIFTKRMARVLLSIFRLANSV